MADLITLAEYKSYKNITNPVKDSVYATLISSVSNLIKAYCGRTFIDYYDTPKVERFSIEPGMTGVMLEEHPLRLVSIVNSNSTDISVGVNIDAENGVIYYVPGFHPGKDVLQVTYTGGYEDTPADIKLAALELVDYYASSEHKSKKTFGNTTIEYHSNGQQWPFHIRGILDMYRDV